MEKKKSLLELLVRDIEANSRALHDCPWRESETFLDNCRARAATYFFFLEEAKLTQKQRQFALQRLENLPDAKEPYPPKALIDCLKSLREG
jgi:hypothetical protein